MRCTHHQVGRALGGGDAQVAHFLRQARQRLRHAVLNLHLRAVDVRADLEGDGENERAIHGRLRRHVEHVVDADDGLSRGEAPSPRSFRVRAGVSRAYHDGRRDNFRVLRHRQPEQRDGPGDGDEGGENGREHRPFDEEMRKFHR
jgi:hypothetical protein